jgi:hypothetical protein
LVIDPVPAAALIVGENAVGKTNLLYGLRLLLDLIFPTPHVSWSSTGGAAYILGLHRLDACEAERRQPLDER